MAIPSWRQNLPTSYDSARVWGTGINPVHSLHSDVLPTGRVGYPPNLPAGYMVGTPQTEVGVEEYDWEWDATDQPVQDLGFTEAHPNLDEKATRAKSTSAVGNPNADWPAWGSFDRDSTQGVRLRSFKTAMGWREQHAQEIPEGVAGGGWVHKEHAPEELDARDSGTLQLYMQTSSQQRNKIQDNSRAVFRGTDDSRSEIASRLTPMKVKEYAPAGTSRHTDMFPRQIEYRPRGWRFRSVGTADVSWMTPNEQRDQYPIRRDVPPDVWQGNTEAVLSEPDGYYSEDYYA